MQRMNLFTIFCLLEMFLLSDSLADNQARVSDQIVKATTESKSSTLYPIQQNGKWGFMDQTGKIIINPQFDTLILDLDLFQATFDSSEGLSPVKVGDKCGYIDKNGRFVINPQFDVAGNFSEGLARVKVGDKWGYINRTGRFVINPQFGDAKNFRDGLSVVDINAKWGYIDKVGKYIIFPQFNYAAAFSEGLASVMLGKKWGYIDKIGKYVIYPQFEDARNFNEGVAPVRFGSKWGYIDKTGKNIINPQYDSAYDFSEGLARVVIGTKWGYIDKTGQYVISMQFDWASNFSEGMASVKLGDKWGYIDKTGKYIINPQFDQADGYKDGLASVEIKGNLNYIDKAGKYIWNPGLNIPAIPKVMKVESSVGDKMEILSFDPPLPAKLKAHQPLNIELAYTLVSKEEAILSIGTYVAYMGPKCSEVIVKKGQGKATVSFVMPSWDSETRVPSILLCMEPYPKILNDPRSNHNLVPLEGIKINATWIPEVLNLTIPAETTSNIPRPIPAGATVIDSPGFIREGMYDETGWTTLKVKKLAFVGKIRENGKVEVHAKPGDEFTLGMTVTYQVDKPMKIAANLKPDVHAWPKKSGNDIEINRLRECYNSTMHFDTETRPGYSSASGQNEIEFTLTSWAPNDTGRYEKLLTIGFFTKPWFGKLVEEYFPFTLVVETPSGAPPALLIPH